MPAAAAARLLKLSTRLTSIIQLGAVVFGALFIYDIGVPPQGLNPYSFAPVLLTSPRVRVPKFEGEARR